MLVSDEPQVFGEWRRTGYCCRCGDCCRDSESPTGYCSLFVLHWDQAREGFQGHCADRSSDTFTAGCDVWPQHPAQIADKPHCTYRFERWPVAS